ncbi:hypothetical protein [Bacillus bingmayongensis]|uniref:hypothetical protein n=1 Tax=Bacillus bingmayongensis TaxID=1150157 RepID=UPI001ED9B8A0|nr:hypothetical protein [Bacillus bingmayongensis]
MKFKIWSVIRGALIAILIVSIFIPLIIFDGNLIVMTAYFKLLIVFHEPYL